jgi:hypothetical protein
LHVWRHPKRKFAALHEGKFTVLGGWDSEEFRRHNGVKELLVLPAEMWAAGELPN